MAKISRQAGSTSHILTIFCQDATSTTGAGLTGLVPATSGLACYYKRNRGTASVAVSLATVTTLGTYVSGGFREVDSVGLPGFYEFHPPDAAIAAGSGSVAFLLRGATNMVPCPIEIELTGINNQDAQAGGMAALPATGTLAVKPAVTLAAADVSGNLPGDLQTIKTQAVTAAAGVTFPASVGTSTYAGGAVAAVTGAVGSISGVTFPTNFATLAINGSGYVTTTGSGSPPTATTIAGSTASSVTVSGLPAGHNYVGQHLYHIPSGEARTIAGQSYASGNYTFTFGSGAGEAGPFNAAPTAGDLFSPVP